MTDTTITYRAVTEPKPALRITRTDAAGNTLWNLDLVNCDSRYARVGLPRIIDQVAGDGIAALFDEALNPLHVALRQDDPASLDEARAILDRLGWQSMEDATYDDPQEVPA